MGRGGLWKGFSCFGLSGVCEGWEKEGGMGRKVSQRGGLYYERSVEGLWRGLVGAYVRLYMNTTTSVDVQSHRERRI